MNIDVIASKAHSKSPVSIAFQNFIMFVVLSTNNFIVFVIIDIANFIIAPNQANHISVIVCKFAKNNWNAVVAISRNDLIISLFSHVNSHNSFHRLVNASITHWNDD